MTDDDPMAEDPMADLAEEELREAEELARALDRGSADDPPDDALSAAALLRYSQGGGELAGARQDEIFAEVLETARPKRPALAKKRGWLAWLLPAGGVAMTAAAVALAVGLQAPGAPVAVELPAPDQGLLTAQASAAADTSTRAAEALASQMRTYRGDVFAALEERYAE